MKKQIITDENLGDIEATNTAELSAERKSNFKSKRGAKLQMEKPYGAKRVLVSAKVTTNRPKNVYKERIVDVESGEAGWMIWYMTEQSEYIGKEEIVKYNPRTEEELTQGYDFTIEFSVEYAKELIAKSFGGTSFYLKDGEDTYTVQKNDLEQIFLKDYQVGLTPKMK